MEGIKNILFDLGGVLVDLDRFKAIAAFEKLGFTTIESYLGDYGQKGPFLALESGEIDEAEFYDAIRKEIPHASDEEIAHAFMLFLQGLPVSKLAMLRDLKAQGYRILMLSNTNAIMFPFICDTYFKQEGYDVHTYFDDIFLSYEMKAIKPEAKIFAQIIEKAGIDPTETLFIDDSQENLDAAQPFGFETYLAQPRTDFSHIFRG